LNDREMTALAGRVVEQLRARSDRLVLAESCTGGLGAALLARIPGVSEVLSGSAVVYQVETKARWLGVSRALLDTPGPVSPEVASAMAAGALTITPHATVSAAITGHLGPGAPLSQDGLAFVAFASRVQGKQQPRIVIKKLELSKELEDRSPRPLQKRLRRQRSAAVHLLEWILLNLAKAGRR
jgi:nicotinamide-nucleotide amidase